MKCKKARRELLGFVDGSLEGEGRRAVAEHLWVCPQCAEEERRLRSVAEALGRVRAVAPSPSLLHSTRSEVAALRRGALARGKGVVRGIWHLSPTALAVVAVLVVGSGLLMAHSATTGLKARELRQLQQRIEGQGLLRQAHLSQREMPQLADQMVLAGVELVLREVVNLSPDSAGQQGLEQLKRRVTMSKLEDSLTSLVGRSEGREKRALTQLLRAIEDIEKL